MRTCARCGDYMCSVCASGARPELCPACAARAGSGSFPFTRDNYTPSALFNYVVSVWRDNWVRLALATLLFMFVVYAPAFVLQLAVSAPDDAEKWSGMGISQLVTMGLTQVAMMVLDTAATLVFSGYALDLLQGRAGGWGARFARLRALPAQLGALFCIYFGVGLLLGAGAVVFQLCGGFAGLPRSAFITALLALLAVPLIGYMALGLVFLTFQFAHTPRLSPLAALRGSFEIVRDKRASVALVITLSTLLTLLGLGTCFIGVFFTMPLGMLWSGALFLALGQRS